MKKVAAILLIIVALLVGFLTGQLFTFKGIELEGKLNFGDLLVGTISIVFGLITTVITIGATLAAAYYVSKILDKQKEDDRTEKDIILKKVEDILPIVESSYVVITKSEKQLTEVIATLKKITVPFEHVFKILEISELNIDPIYETNIQTVIKSIRTLATKTPRSDSEQIPNEATPISVANGVVSYSGYRLIELENAFNQLRFELFQFQIMINAH